MSLFEKFLILFLLERTQRIVSQFRHVRMKIFGQLENKHYEFAACGKKKKKSFSIRLESEAEQRIGKHEAIVEPLVDSREEKVVGFMEAICSP